MESMVLAEKMKVVRANANCETALSGLSALPASGSFVDVSGFEVAHIIVHLGTVHTSDSPVFTPKCSDAANGTLDVIDSSLAKTPDPDADDGQFLVWSIQVNKLALDHHFLAVALSGTLTNGSYADVIFLLEGGSEPVSQSATYLPSDNQFTWVG
jgi:hypothetical protein